MRTKSKNIRINATTHNQLMKMCKLCGLSASKFMDKIVPEMYEVFGNFTKIKGFFLVSDSEKSQIKVYVGGTKIPSNVIVGCISNVPNSVSGEEGDRIACRAVERALNKKFEVEKIESKN